MGRFSIDYLRDEIEKLNTAHPGKVELEVEKKVYSSTEKLKVENLHGQGIIAKSNGVRSSDGNIRWVRDMPIF